VAVPTKDAFSALRIERSGGIAAVISPSPQGGGGNRAVLLARIADDRNDLEAPAIAIAPEIADVLAALRALAGCILARMSGSGATCFGLFDTTRAAIAAAQTLRMRHVDWWVRPTVLAR